MSQDDPAAPVVPPTMFPVPQGATASGASHLQWLAGLAMQSIVLRMDSVPDTEAEREEIALWSYRLAQAMKKMELRIQTTEAEAGHDI